MNGGPLLGLGLVLGARHALEADHVAAVASLASRSRVLGDTARIAAAWGLGHGLALLLIGGLLRALGLALPPGASRVLEGAAALLLIVLGIDVIRRARPILPSAAPRTSERPILRSLVLGSLHGLAGSSVLVVAIVPAFASHLMAFAYLVLFAIGCIVGMVLCSLVIYLPVQRARRGLRNFQIAVGGASIGIGVWIALGTLRGS